MGKQMEPVDGAAANLSRLNKLLLSSANLLVLALTPPAPSRAQLSPSPLSLPPIRIILVGDSTMAPHTGWGGTFCAYHLNENAACLNLARGGRSTRTYRTEKFWNLVRDELGVTGYRATYVLIQMGHNDKSMNSTVGTDLNREFPENLQNFIQESRALGAIPVLVTPLATRHFKQNAIYNTLLPWAEQVEAVATRSGTPLVDLNRQSAELFQKLGPLGSTSFSAVPPTEIERKAAEAGTTLPPRVPKSLPVSSEAPADDPRRRFTQDYTHLNNKGAEAISSIVAARLAIAVPELRAYLVP